MQNMICVSDIMLADIKSQFDSYVNKCGIFDIGCVALWEFKIQHMSVNSSVALPFHASVVLCLRYFPCFTDPQIHLLLPCHSYDWIHTFEQANYCKVIQTKKTHNILLPLFLYSAPRRDRMFHPVPFRHSSLYLQTVDSWRVDCENCSFACWYVFYCLRLIIYFSRLDI